MGDLIVPSDGGRYEVPPNLFRPPPTSPPEEVREDHRLQGPWLSHVGRWRVLHQAFLSEIEKLWHAYDYWEKDRQRIRTDEGREPTYWPAIVYLLAMLALFAFEVPFNQQAFEFAFLASRNVSWVIATIIAVVLLLVAHYVGIRIRQFWYNAERFRVRYDKTGTIWFPAALQLFVVLLAILFAASLTYIVALFRQGYFRLVASANGGRVDVAELLSHTFRNLYLEAPGWMMFAINGGIVIAAVICCMLAHDPNADYERVDTEFKRAKERFYGLLKRYNERIAESERVFTNECEAVRDGRSQGP